MSACSLFDRLPIINMETTNPSSTLFLTPGGPGGGGGQNPHPHSQPPPAIPDDQRGEVSLERDYYGCYCLKFLVKNGSHVTEDKVLHDFGQFGEVVDVRGPGLFSGLRGNHVYVRYIDCADAEEALRQLVGVYAQLTPASISDVLPDNYGLYTISFYNKTGIPSNEVRTEFSKFGEVKNLTGSLDVKGGRVFVSYKEKASAVQALQAFFFRKDKYPNMKFALPRCEKDYFGCYCLKFYNKSGDVTEEKVLKDFGQFGEVVDVRGPGLFDVTGDDVYVRYKEKSSAEQALIELVGKYDSLCLAPPSDIQADKFGYFTITFVNDKCLSKSDVWYIFSKFGTVACVNGTFDCKKGRVFVSYKEKQGALNALETMLITKEYHLQVSKNSTVRKNDYNVVGGNLAKDVDSGANNTGNDFDFSSKMMFNGNNDKMSANSSVTVTPSNSSSRLCPDSSNLTSTMPPPPVTEDMAVPPPPFQQNNSNSHPHKRELSRSRDSSAIALTSSMSSPQIMQQQQQQQQHYAGNSKNGMVKFNRNVEKDIFGYFCLSFLNEDGDINEKKVRHDFGKFGEVVSVRGALGKQKGHVFVRFSRKEAAENCLNCLNSFPLSEMSELFGKYLFLSPATPRDIDCDMYGLYSISFLNLNMKTFREIRQEFSKFGEIFRLTSGGGGSTDELISISYSDKMAAINALRSHFTNKEYPYLDIAKGSSLLLVNSSDSSDNEDNNEPENVHYQRNHPPPPHDHLGARPPAPIGNTTNSSDPFHDPWPTKNGAAGSDVVDELLKPLQSYFNIYSTGQYHSLHGEQPKPDHKSRPYSNGGSVVKSQGTSPSRSPDKNYKFQQMNKHAKPKSEPHSSSKDSISTTIPPPPPPANTFPFSVPPPSTAPRDMNNSTTTKMPSVLSLSKQANSSSNSSVSTSMSSSTQASPEREIAEEQLQKKVQNNKSELSVREDVLGYYSLMFPKSKDLSDRKVRQDFSDGNRRSIARVRGLGKGESVIAPPSSSENVSVSFNSISEAKEALLDTELRVKYCDLVPIPPAEVIPDKDGAYSIEFINSGMSGIREITNDFSRFGEVVKVMAGGAKNAVKKVTVSYADKDASIEAVRAHANSKDYRAIDFARECVEWTTK